MAPELVTKFVKLLNSFNLKDLKLYPKGGCTIKK